MRSAYNNISFHIKSRYDNYDNIKNTHCVKDYNLIAAVAWIIIIFKMLRMAHVCVRKLERVTWFYYIFFL